MYKEILQSIENVQIWPIISFCIFFLFFLILSWWAITADKKYINEMREMPLRDGDAEIDTPNL
jgi:cytochrome c oxidase cbb3-type subunit IV